jgi:hypothetical protein
MRNSFGTSIPLAVGIAALALAPLAAQADMKSEVVTAATHAGLAAGAPDLAGTHSHLHHALNCLVGPNGAGFDAKELNPCAQNGHGAIPDAADAGTKKSLMAAADKAKAGIAATDLKTAQKDASEASAMLKAVK